MRQLDVFRDGSILVPLRLYWIGCSQNRCSCIQWTNDASLCDRQCLLLLWTKSIHLVRPPAKGLKCTLHTKKNNHFSKAEKDRPWLNWHIYVVIFTAPVWYLCKVHRPGENDRTHHDFMEDRTSWVAHLVKLINAAHTIVTQHQSTAEGDTNTIIRAENPQVTTDENH